ncbi:hypothetical protein ACJIZ3_020646 [Penstemon smallii]|uniref:DNA excision repair protein ERCC-1 n=1 Tax=Penstemon smallii TaxID=265156 RepID=A0ABD3SJZ0_9LAMI
MENKDDPGNRQQQQCQKNDKQKEKDTTSFVIRIPSYEEVVESSQTKTTPSSLFNASPSFSQAFNFVKTSEFYTAPPPPPPPQSSHASQPRQHVQSEVPSTSSSATTGVSRNSILVSHRQKGNPLLKHIRNVRWEFSDIVCDYLMGRNSCALYLSLRYHLLHPDYLYFRIRELQKKFKLRVILCHVDVEDVVKPLLEVTKTALLHDCTLLCAWSLEECGRYLETIKVYENKPADLIQGQMDMDYLSRLNHALTSLRHVNKTDVVTLGSTFGSLSHIMDASMEDLARCPGIGERKVKGLYDTFHEPFKRVVPHHSTTTESPVDHHTGSISGSKRKEDEKEIPDSSKRSKKEGETSVKSALEAAFAKYKGVTGRKSNKVEQDKMKDKTVAAEQVNENDDDFAS